MDDKVQKMFVINMVLNGMNESQIARNLNVSVESIETIINENARVIEEKRKQRENEKIEKEKKAREIIKIKSRLPKKKEVKFKEEPQKDIEKDEIVKRFLNSNKKNKTLSELRDRIVKGQEYSMEEVANVAKRVKRTCMIRKNKDLVLGMAEIYMQLNLYQNAMAFVREIYDDETKTRDKIVKEIEKKELRYHVMKKYRAGKTYDEISRDMNIYTVEVIKIVREELQFDDEIISMLENGMMSKEEIIEVFSINIKRINDAQSTRNIRKELSER